MQNWFIGVWENTQWRKTHRAEAGGLSLWASRELFLQASPRRWHFQGEASVLWEGGGVTHLATGKAEEIK